VARLRWDPAEEPARRAAVAALRADPDALGWWVWLAERDGVGVGAIGFGGRPGPDRRLTVGYAVHEEHRGRGYATEMLELLTEWALGRPEVELVRATIQPDNRPSLRVAEKAGFVASGARVQDDEHGELLVYVRRR
jgi:RimJ/RimL family protein N-acetyltransferase